MEPPGNRGAAARFSNGGENPQLYVEVPPVIELTDEQRENLRYDSTYHLGILRTHAEWQDPHREGRLREVRRNEEAQRLSQPTIDISGPPPRAPH